MIKVGLVTSWEDRCGISEYAKHVVEYSNKPGEVEVRVIPYPFEGCQNEAKDFDIIQMNECGYTCQGFTGQTILKLRDMGKKTLLTQHASNPKNNKNALSLQFDRVVIHERNTEDGFTFIPQGAVVYEPANGVIAYDVGTCGFPLGFKNNIKLAEATARLGWTLFAMLPESHHADAKQVAAQMQRANARCHVETHWQTDLEMVNKFNACKMTCFPYTNHTPGPSSAAMMGISARRPVIISRSQQFAHIFGRDDEFTFIESDNPTVSDIVEGLLRATEKEKIPEKTYQEHRWDRVGELYRQLYKEMVQ